MFYRLKRFYYSARNFVENHLFGIMTAGIAASLAATFWQADLDRVIRVAAAAIVAIGLLNLTFVRRLVDYNQNAQLDLRHQIELIRTGDRPMILTRFALSPDEQVNVELGHAGGEPITDLKVTFKPDLQDFKGDSVTGWLDGKEGQIFVAGDRIDASLGKIEQVRTALTRAVNPMASRYEVKISYRRPIRDGQRVSYQYDLELGSLVGESSFPDAVLAAHR